MTMVRRSPRRTAVHAAQPPTAAARRGRRAALALWPLLAGGDIISAATPVPWLPVQLHSLALAALVALTVLAIHLHQQVPVRAAFLDGMLWEREHPHSVDLPRAVGDEDTVVISYAKVLPMQRATNGGRHHKPGPGPRPTAR